VVSQALWLVLPVLLDIAWYRLVSPDIAW